MHSTNPNVLSHAVNELLDKPFVCRPYNRFAPDDTVWWLVPSSDWPAYKFGKLFFDRRTGRVPGDADGIYCGFDVEKGLSPKVKEFYHSDLIHGHDWIWDQFIQSASTSFPKLPSPQYLTVLASYIPIEKARYIDSPESFFAQKDNFEASRVTFAIVDDHLNVVGTPVLNPSTKEIADHFELKVSGQSTVSGLLRNLEEFPQSEWSWLNIYTGTVISDPDPHSLWEAHLKHWSQWLRSGN